MKKYIVIGLVLLAAALLYFSQLQTPQERLSHEAPTDDPSVSRAPLASGGWASSAAQRALSKTSTTRAVASIPWTAHVPAPTTEAGALALLQSQSSTAWDVRRADFSEQIRTLVHGQWKTKDELTTRTSADEFVKTYSQALFGVDSDRVQFDREEVTDRTRVTYQEVVNGIPVYGSTLNLFFENGALTRLQNDMAAGEPTSSSALINLTLAQAFENYKTARGGGVEISFAKDIKSRPIFYPSGHSLVYAYEFSTNEVSKASSNSESFRVIYDAEVPHIIKRISSHIQ